MIYRMILIFSTQCQQPLKVSIAHPHEVFSKTSSCSVTGRPPLLFLQFVV